MSDLSLSKMPKRDSRFNGKCSPEKEEQLRDQIHKELTKARYCANPTYKCSLVRIEGYKFCIRHILWDPLAPFRRCAFEYLNRRQCINAVPKYDARKKEILTPLCFEHNRQLQMRKARMTLGCFRSGVETNETLLNSLAHHLNVNEPEAPKPVDNKDEDDDVIDVVSPQVTPFLPQEYRNSVENVAGAVVSRKRILEYASDISSDDEDPPCARNTLPDVEFDESDYESIDSDYDDPLKHGGVYTRPEAVKNTLRKVEKLQTLYGEELKFLARHMRKRRRQYLIDLRKEQETYCSILDQAKKSPHELKLYQKLRALNSYHRRQGKEAYFYKRYREKRDQSKHDYVRKTFYVSKCIFNLYGHQCGLPAIQSTKHCRRHILSDRRQMIFRDCGEERNGNVCQDPVWDLGNETCELHRTLEPPRKQYKQKFYEPPINAPAESIFAPRSTVDRFVLNQTWTEPTPAGQNITDTSSAAFDYDVDTLSGLSNFIANEFLDVGNEVTVGRENDSQDTEATDQGNIAIEQDLDQSVILSTVGEANNNLSDIMKMLEGIESAPWFESTMNDL
ncbi:KAT8 regulatory NSL complex subunit 2-like isoform X1 [Drosophila pseudoobscura]|uniref:KAT8 regulatory NSL complex subunit 2 n=1 Tax=Drosophila pseudoobscura pseudoobscura TaxID=46245 RepID=A0A6I8V203_DROPS|nr:KAT8 regulatory NSL complex subunit 2 isoform X1 [Drosophila pseudoobscura]